MDITFRKMELSDAAEAKRFHRSVPNPFDVDLAFAMLDPRLGRQDLFIGAFRGTQCVGIQLLYLYDLEIGGRAARGAHSTFTLADPAIRSQGLGSRIIRHSVQECPLPTIDFFTFCVDSRLTGKWEDECISIFMQHSKTHTQLEFRPAFLTCDSAPPAVAAARQILPGSDDFLRFQATRAASAGAGKLYETMNDATLAHLAGDPDHQMVLMVQEPGGRTLGYLRFVVQAIVKKDAVAKQAILTELFAREEDRPDCLLAAQSHFGPRGCPLILVNNALSADEEFLERCGFQAMFSEIHFHFCLRQEDAARVELLKNLAPQDVFLPFK